MSDAEQPQWPREIWCAAVEEHEFSGDYVLSEAATIPRWEGDTERDRDWHRFIDADIYDSADKYWRARLKAAEARPAVRVKPLVWEEHDGKSYRQANCVLGQYQVAWLGEFECWQLSRPNKAEQEWKEAFSRHSNKDAAKAAAQADYETRILAAAEALDLTPVREALHQYINDMKYPPAADSRERRIAMAQAALALIDGEQDNG